ncbi:hypothetical protein M758_6G172400 [Ceratodon purpureus]|nr:hypothetical protein M758_6G172400 [Ceratodon purpureus]
MMRGVHHGWWQLMLILDIRGCMLSVQRKLRGQLGVLMAPLGWVLVEPQHCKQVSACSFSSGCKSLEAMQIRGLQVIRGFQPFRVVLD